MDLFKLPRHVVRSPAPSPQLATDPPSEPVMTAGRNEGVSIVILDINSADFTIPCIDSIAAAATQVPYELVLVLNGGQPEWKQKMLDYISVFQSRFGITPLLVNNADNNGFPGGCNQGMQASTLEHVCLLNNDTIVSDGWLDTLMDTYTHHPRCGILGPLVDNISEPSQKVPLGSSDGYLVTRRLTGCCMLLGKTRFLDRVGLLDERFNPGTYEDDDWCLRTFRAGLETAVCTNALIHHECSKSWVRVGINMHSLLQINAAKFKAKWTNIQAVPAASPVPGRAQSLRNQRASINRGLSPTVRRKAAESAQRVAEQQPAIPTTMAITLDRPVPVFGDLNDGIVCVTVVCRNRFNYTNQTLNSFLASAPKVPWELTIVDNGSTDGTIDHILAFKQQHLDLPIRVVRLQHATSSISEAVNLGWYIGRGHSFFVKLDNDILQQPGCIDRMVKVLECSKIGMVGVQVAGKVQPQEFIDTTAIAKAHFTLGTPFIWGALIMMRADVLNTVGVLNETMPRNEDLEWSGRLARYGYAICYLPHGERCTHLGAVATEGASHDADRARKIHQGERAYLKLQAQGGRTRHGTAWATILDKADLRKACLNLTVREEIAAADLSVIEEDAIGTVTTLGQILNEEALAPIFKEAAVPDVDVPATQSFVISVFKALSRVPVDTVSAMMQRKPLELQALLQEVLPGKPVDPYTTMTLNILASLAKRSFMDVTRLFTVASCNFPERSATR